MTEINGDTPLNEADVVTAFIVEMKLHKNYCNDLSCHVYDMLSRAVGDAIGKFGRFESG
jgi:hypothetical protein